MKEDSKIVVAGDVTIDWLQWETKLNKKSTDNRSSNWTIYPGTRMKAEEGGALLLARMVMEATNAEVITHELRNIESISPETVLHSFALLDTYPLSTEGKEKVFRIRHQGGFNGPEGGNLNALPVAHDDEDALLVILDDAGNGFRDDKTVWPMAILDKDKEPVIILKMSRPLASGALWDHLVKEHTSRVIVIINANDLREMGVRISRRLSWEQTAEDFSWQIVNNPGIRSIGACKNLIVRFGLDGAIHYTNCDGKIKATLYYDPTSGEDGYKEQHKGEMQGETAAFVAAFASRVLKEGFNGIESGIREGILKSRQLLRRGFGAANVEPSYPIKLFSEPMNGAETICTVTLPTAVDKALNGGGNWRIFEECTRGKLESIAYGAVLRPTEDSMKAVPSARFSALFTFDRIEIESYRSIKNLMTEYMRRKDATVPLSIAVFGPPGSGKSFGVTQLALKFDPQRVFKMEFNVAQFTSIDDLTDAFHKVRDLVLEGKIPLVFFDEFDTSFNGELGWLKYFLAPMQDGMFKEGGTTHPIGRSIFVFAGGTSSTFQQFSRENIKGKQDDKENTMKKFRDAKGKDFVSRLRGYVNVMGPNRAGDDDTFFIIRRALLLRSLLVRKAPQLFDDNGNACIDSGVLRGFLKVPAYKHGARSMEAIIEMSMLTGKRRFDQASLPPHEQLELHVDSDIFSKLVLRDVLFSDAMERLAREIHERYRVDQRGKKDPDDPVMQPWENLREDLKESNRKQASQMPEKLQRIGFDFMPFFEKTKTPLVLSDEQVEILAEMEHQRWVTERSEDGWILGSSRDPERKISPYLVPWSELAEEVKEWGRNLFVRQIPELLKGAGFEAYRLQ